MSSKKIMIINHTPPYGSANVIEAVDMLLATSAFVPSTSVVWMDEGIYQLLPAQMPESIGVKPVTAAYQCLELYDIHQCYVEAESLLKLGLSAKSLICQVDVIASKEISVLMQQQDIILHF